MITTIEQTYNFHRIAYISLLSIKLHQKAVFEKSQSQSMKLQYSYTPLTKGVFLKSPFFKLLFVDVWVCHVLFTIRCGWFSGLKITTPGAAKVPVERLRWSYSRADEMGCALPYFSFSACDFFSLFFFACKLLKQDISF